MPLLISPIDNKTPMQQINYRGVEIDRCPVSGGVWLDAGELEKLLNNVHAAVQEDRHEYQAYRNSHPVPHHDPHYPQGHSHKGYKHHDDYDDYYHKKHGKKGALRELFDIFD